jgi:hypothetical protein
MKTLRSRLRRHLSYANVMATIAVFVVFGGVSYAATNINGNQIVKGSVGAGKLKNGTLTSTQVKANSLTGSSINESSLGTVPSAQTATSATTASSANTAQSATTAGNANTVGGLSANQLQVACPADTELFGGMCWDATTRDADGWFEASVTCGNAGGRLPSLSELIAYAAQGGTQLANQNWTGDVIDVSGGKEKVLTSDEFLTSASDSSPTNLDYRCLFYRVN